MSAPIFKKLTDYDKKILGTLNILLAEDNLLNVKLISVLFSLSGLKLEIAMNGAEAVEKIKTNSFDIVLMDIEMPVLNGYQATSVIRQQLNNNIPIIAMTAGTMPGEKEKCLQAGMNDYIAKPINEDHLFTAIYNLTCSDKPAFEKKGITIPLVVLAVTEKICKLDYLVTITRGNKKMMNNIIDIFMEVTPAELSALDAAIKKTDYNIIRDICHKIKSSFSLLGIAAIEPVFAEMEHLGAIASGIEKIKLLNGRLNNLFIQSREEMKQVL